MQVLPVDIDLRLAEGGYVDLFIFQLFSPSPVEYGVPSKLPAELAGRRLDLFTKFHEWLQNIYCNNFPNSSYFVVTPELSVTPNHLDVLTQIAKAGGNSAGVVAGLEFLDWEEYVDLVDASDMPQKQSWTEGGGNARKVNAALILLRESTGQIRKFVQPKRNPSDGEVPTHFPNQNALFFRSTDQAQGRRLNFSIQICSDFTDHTQVSEFRRECETVCDGRPIDFTFLLQMNKDQFAPHFQRSIQAYFDPPNQMIDTSHGCLVFSNAASRQHGKSKNWGRSMLLFPWNTRHWRTKGAPTYWLRDEQASNQQAVVMREPGACLYWLRYKPHYLVNPIAGSGQPGPFVDNHALALRLDGETFPNVPQFAPIPAVTHWLLSEWDESKAEFLQQLDTSPADVVQWCDASYDAMRALWRNVLQPDDLLARKAVALYFLCFGGKVLSDKSPEPVLWEDDITRNARRFLFVLCLLGAAAGDGGVKVRPGDLEHAGLGDDAGLALICAENRSLSSILVTAIKRIDSPISALLRTKYLIVVIACLEAPDGATMADIVTQCRERITDSATNTDDITSPDEPAEIVVVCDQSIWGGVLNANSVADARARVLACIGM